MAAPSLPPPNISGAQIFWEPHPPNNSVQAAVDQGLVRLKIAQVRVRCSGIGIFGELNLRRNYSYQYLISTDYVATVKAERVYASVQRYFMRLRRQ